MKFGIFYEHQAKQQRMEPIARRAMARKRFLAPLADAEIPAIQALGRPVDESEAGQTPSTGAAASGLPVPLADPGERAT